MKLFMDRNRVYLVCFYFSMSFFYLSFVLGEQDPVPLLGYILALIIFIVLSHDSLLKIINQSTGHTTSQAALVNSTALLELNQKILPMMDAQDVLVLVNDTLSKNDNVGKVVYLLASSLVSTRNHGSVEVASGPQQQLVAWPGSVQWKFLTAEFENYIAHNPGPITKKNAPALLNAVFEETGAGLLISVLHNDMVLCVILISKHDNEKPYSATELKMLDFLAAQLSVILDRIRIYAAFAHQCSGSS